MRTAHTSTNRGRMVEIILKNGKRVVDKFMSRTDRFVYLKLHGKVNKCNIRSFRQVKGGVTGRDHKN